MTTPAIHVHTQADKSTVPYVKFMWETMLSTANHPELLHITVHCMGPSAVDRIKAFIQQGRAVLVPNRKGDPLNGSRGHAVCIMNALSMTGDGEIHIIADSDTVTVAKGWDDYIRNRLVNDNVGMIGTTYEDLGGFSSGGTTIQTYKKVPTFTWAALNPMHNWRDLDVSPNKAHSIAITTQKLSEIYNLPIGYNVFGEAAYQVPQYLHDHKLSYEGWPQLKPTKTAIVLKGLSDYHEEYNAESVPFVVHHRGSLRLAYRSDRFSRAFYGAVDAYLAIEATHEPRWKWQDTGKVLIPVAPVAREAAPQVGPVIEVTPENFVSSGNEWLKVGYNGTVIRVRKKIDRKLAAAQLDFKPPVDGLVGHVRVEGVLEHKYPIVLPQTTTIPYMVTVRNATGGTLMVSCGKGESIAVPATRTWLILVDIDTAQHVG